jgi:hypothetical protein
MGKFREWIIKGGKLMSGAIAIHCDGPVPAINENVRVIELQAFTDAVELIDETQKAMQSFKEQTEKHGGDYLPAHAVWFNECLAKIKEFKEKGE